MKIQFFIQILDHLVCEPKKCQWEHVLISKNLLHHYSLLRSTTVKAGKFSPSLRPTPFSTVTTPTLQFVSELNSKIGSTSFANSQWNLGNLEVAHSLVNLPSQRQVKDSWEGAVGLSSQPWAAEAALGIQSNSDLYSVKWAWATGEINLNK